MKKISSILLLFLTLISLYPKGVKPQEINKNNITTNTHYDWIAIIYHNLPTETLHLGRGLSFYLHESTGLDCFPNELAC